MGPVAGIFQLGIHLLQPCIIEFNTQLLPIPIKAVLQSEIAERNDGSFIKCFLKVCRDKVLHGQLLSEVSQQPTIKFRLPRRTEKKQELRKVYD